jgi:hypothetical protein
MKIRLLSFAVLLVAMVARVAVAQEGRDISGSFDVVCVVSDQVADPDVNNKISIIKTNNYDPCEKDPVKHLGDNVNLLVKHGSGASFEDIDEPRPTSLVLFLNGRYLPGTYAKLMRSEAEDTQEEEAQVTWSVLAYRLSRDLSTSDGRKNWTEIVTGGKFGRILDVSTGLEKGQAVPSDAQINLMILTPTRVFIAILIGLALAAILVFLMLRTGALRDKEPAPGLKDPTQRAYSLSRVQAMLWTVLAVYAFLFVYYLTGEYNATIPGSIVTLMAISLGTFGTAAAIDSNASSTKLEKARATKNKVAPEYANLAKEKDAAAQAAQKLEKESAPVADPEAHQRWQSAHAATCARVDELTARLRQDDRNHRLWTRARQLEQSAHVALHSGFWEDLFSNEGGAGLHRIQFGLWTLVLMVVFIYEVFQNVAMPDFDKTLLALMGVSSGAYAGLKVPENKGAGSANDDNSNEDSDEDEDGSD